MDMNSSNVSIIYSKKSAQNNHQIFVNEKNFQIPLVSADSMVNSLEFLENIQNATINGNTILEALQYHENSLWWFLHPTLLPVLTKSINFITKFEKFLDEIKPSVVKISEDFQTFEIIAQLCKKKRIKLEYSRRELLQFKTKQRIILQGQKYRYNKIFSNKSKKRKDLFYQNKKKNSSNLHEKFVFAVPTIYRRGVLNIKTGKSEQGEYIQQTIFDLVKNKGEILGIDIDYTFKGDFEILSERLKSDVDWVPLEIFVNDEYNDEHKTFLRNYKKILDNNNFQNLFEYKGISIWKQIESTLFKMNFAPYFSYYLNLIDSMNRLLSEKKPKTIFLTYETGPMALSIIIAARRYGIKTIGIAHSLIPKILSMDSYLYRSTDIQLGFPIPDYTLVFGNSSKENLISYGYPKNKIITFGNAAFFNLDDIITILDYSSLHEKYNVNPKQKVILFTTEYLQEYHTSLGKYDYDTQILMHLLENFSNNDGFLIILKPHPTENPQSYEKIIKKYTAKNFKVIQGNLFELIWISNMVISVYSNSMMDAICLKKPVIRVIFENVEHTVPYDEYEVVISCELRNLSATINNIVSDEKLREKLSRNRDTFIKKEYNLPEDNPKSLLDKILNDAT